MSLPRPADVPALATRATLPEVDPFRDALKLGAHLLPRGTKISMIEVPSEDAAETEAERLATWDRVLP